MNEMNDNTKYLENEIDRLKEGIDNVIFCLANEDIYDVNVINEIRMALVKLYKGGAVNKHPFNE